MNYNRAMAFLLALLLVVPARPAAAAPRRRKAAETGAAAGTADKTTVELVEYFLKVPTSDANPELVDPFLAVKTETLPARLRGKARAKQIEIRALIKVHDAKKKGMIVQRPAGCTMDSFVRPFSDEYAYRIAHYVPITEDEELYLLKQTGCVETDLGCEFSLTIFHDAGSTRPRRLMLHESDPLMGIVARYREHGSGGTRFFGTGLFCPKQ